MWNWEECAGEEVWCWRGLGVKMAWWLDGVGGEEVRWWRGVGGEKVQWLRGFHWTLKMGFPFFSSCKGDFLFGAFYIFWARPLLPCFICFCVCFDTTLCLSDIRWGLCVALCRNGIPLQRHSLPSTSMALLRIYRVYHLHSAFLQRPIYKRMLPDGEYI